MKSELIAAWQESCIRIYLGYSVSQKKDMPLDMRNAWDYGANLYTARISPE